MDKIKDIKFDIWGTVLGCFGVVFLLLSLIWPSFIPVGIAIIFFIGWVLGWMLEIIFNINKTY